MAIVAGFDVHRRQITFDVLDTDTGEVVVERRGGEREPAVLVDPVELVQLPDRVEAPALGLLGADPVGVHGRGHGSVTPKFVGAGAATLAPPDQPDTAAPWTTWGGAPGS